jgi:hypothetical protein
MNCFYNLRYFERTVAMDQPMQIDTEDRSLGP